MREIKTMMETCQDINLTEKGISFAEEGFTQLYNQLNTDIRVVGVTSAIGGVLMGVGLSMMSIGVYSLIKRRKLKGIEKEIDIELGKIIKLVETSLEADKKLNE